MCINKVKVYYKRHLKEQKYLGPNSEEHVTDCYSKFICTLLCVTSRCWVWWLAERRAGPSPAHSPFLAHGHATALCWVLNHRLFLPLLPGLRCDKCSPLHIRRSASVHICDWCEKCTSVYRCNFSFGLCAVFSAALCTFSQSCFGFYTLV